MWKPQEGIYWASKPDDKNRGGGVVGLVVVRCHQAKRMLTSSTRKVCGELYDDKNHKKRIVSISP